MTHQNYFVYILTNPDPASAIAREKQLKNWSRKKKEALISKANPEWWDLVCEMYAVSPKGGTR